MALCCLAAGVGKTDMEGTTLDIVLGMLKKALVCSVQAAQHSHPKQSGKRGFKCDVCQNADHSTQSHCTGCTT